MRPIWIPAALMALAVCVEAGERNSPQGDSSRSRPSRSIQGSAAPVQPRDPAEGQYWSDQCRRERAFGMTQSPDCRHPAYLGQGYGPGWPSGPGYGYGGGSWVSGDTIIINQGGTLVVPEPRGQDTRPQGGGMPTYRGWSR